LGARITWKSRPLLSSSATKGKRAVDGDWPPTRRSNSTDTLTGLPDSGR
jgi:hypothetical protein